MAADTTPTRAPATAAVTAADASLRSSFLDALGEAVIATDPYGRILYWNDAAARLYGWGADEVIGSDILDITPAAGLRRRAAEIMATLRQGHGWSGEFLTRHQDGTRFRVRVTNTPVVDTDGRLTAIVGVSRDVSGQHETASALAESQARLNLVRRAAPSVIWELDSETGRVEWSDALTDLFGYELGEIDPTLEWWLDRIHPGDRSRLERSFADYLTEPGGDFWTEEYRFRRADGSYADVFDRAYRVPGEAGSGRLAGAMVDLTDRHQLQNERRVLAQAGMILDLSLDFEATLPTLARLAVDTLTDLCIIQVTDAAHVSAFATAAHADASRQALADGLAARLGPNPPRGSAAGRALELRTPEIVAEPATLFGNEDGASPPDAALAELGLGDCVVVPLVARDTALGYMILGSSSGDGRRVLRLGEELGRRIGAAIDHSRLVEAEQVATRAKSDFLAVMSHELRTPLTAVLGYADLLDQEVSGPLNESQRQQVQRIRAGTDRLHRLVESILVYVRLESGQERATLTRARVPDLLDRAREVVAARAREDGIDFRIETEALPPHLDTDPDRILQILLTLLTNGLKFARTTLVLRAAAADGVFRVDIVDDGPGIPAEHQPYVFNPFWQAEQPSTRRAGGAGLGLSLARRLARLLAGDVVIHESSPEGTTFRFTHPLTTPE